MCGFLAVQKHLSRPASPVVLQAEVDSQCSSVQVALDRRGLLARCVLEAVRLRAPGIDIRVCAANVALPGGRGSPVMVPKVPHCPLAAMRLVVAGAMINTAVYMGLRWSASVAGYSAGRVAIRVTP